MVFLLYFDEFWSKNNLYKWIDHPMCFHPCDLAAISLSKKVPIWRILRIFPSQQMQMKLWFNFTKFSVKSNANEVVTFNFTIFSVKSNTTSQVLWKSTVKWDHAQKFPWNQSSRFRNFRKLPFWHFRGSVVIFWWFFVILSAWFCQKSKFFRQIKCKWS